MPGVAKSGPPVNLQSSWVCREGIVSPAVRHVAPSCWNHTSWGFRYSNWCQITSVAYSGGWAHFLLWQAVEAWPWVDFELKGYSISWNNLFHLSNLTLNYFFIEKIVYKIFQWIYRFIFNGFYKIIRIRRT